MSLGIVPPMVTPIYRQGYYMPNILVGPVAPVAPVAPVVPVAGVAPVAAMDVVPTYPTYPAFPAYPTYPGYPSYPAFGVNPVVNVADCGPTIIDRRCPSYGYNSSPQMNNNMSNPATIVNRISNNNTNHNTTTSSSSFPKFRDSPSHTPAATVMGLSPGQKMIRTYNAKRTKVVRFPRSQDMVRPSLGITSTSTGGKGHSASHGSGMGTGLGRRPIHVHVSARANGRR